MRSPIVALLVAALGVGCQAQVPLEDVYGPCTVDEDCVDEASCMSELDDFTVCRPTCEADADCPAPGRTSATCRREDGEPGECTIGPLGAGDCPEGMVAIASSPSPQAPLVCAWRS